MGSPVFEAGRIDDEIQRKITLTKGFWLQESQVTQELWKAVAGENPSEFTGEPLRPVECVTWNCCRDFIQKLNDGGIVPCGMRLDFPTNAEWEYGCRAGSTSAFSVGGNLTAEDANFNNYIGKTTAVKVIPRTPGDSTICTATLKSGRSIGLKTTVGYRTRIPSARLTVGFTVCEVEATTRRPSFVERHSNLSSLKMGVAITSVSVLP